MADNDVKLTAFRPEAFRFERLAKVLRHAEDLAHAAGKGEQWRGALQQLDDAKGDLTAVWRNPDDIESLSTFVDEAWLASGEREPAAHELFAVTGWLEPISEPVGGKAQGARLSGRRSVFSWVSMIFVALLGLIAGPTLLSVASAVWAALQPQTQVWGWDIVAVLGVFGLLWIIAVVMIATRQRAPVRWIFVAVSLGLAAAPVIVTLLETPSEESYSGTLSPEDAQAWKNFHP